MSSRININKNYKDLFLLNPDITYLNHGSFGACPKAIMDEYFNLQLKLENQPIDFLDNNIKNELCSARKSLSMYVECDSKDLVFFPNPSTALNMVIKSLKINKDDEILTTTHEYGALIKTWKFICAKNSAKYVEFDPILPLDSKEDFLNHFFDKITDRTKVIFISHITSPTAIIFPVQEICEEARKRGIISIIDGAHAPGHIDLSIKSINPDIYVGACHKWMLSPKGSSFLYAKKDMQNNLKPLVISWGWDNDPPLETTFLDNNQWQGTNDISQYLVIPFVINFLNKNKWKVVSDNCKEINLESRNKLLNLFNQDRICRKPKDWLGQMTSIFLPNCNIVDLYKFLKSEKIEVPILEWNGYKILRISIQAYNTHNDINILIDKLQRYFKI
tara:strand:+ start:1598 stop:2764 length:1167 start_codon:yes stop_codon:yes gene_type:complete